MPLLGKLTPGGVLTDISHRNPGTWADGSMEVPLDAIPAFPGPYGYDAPNRMAIVNTAAQTALVQAAQATQQANVFGGAATGWPIGSIPQWNGTIFVPVLGGDVSTFLPFGITSVIAPNYCRYVVDKYEIQTGAFLEIALGGSMEIG